MEVRNVEGVANHNGPESCGGGGNRAGEALTGEHAGQVLSREMEQLRGADAVEKGGRLHPAHRQREVCGNPARSETLCMRGSTATGNRESPWSPVAMSAAGRVGKSKDSRR
jgi:RNA-directed DNA polymerase